MLELISAKIALLFTAAVMSLWFWRRNRRDADLWMYGTYGGVLLIGLQSYFGTGSMAAGVPVVIRDFLLLGVVGLVQSLAVARRISIGMAIVIILGLFVLAYAIPFKDSNSLAVNEGTAAREVPNEIIADPNGEYLIERKPSVTEAALMDWAAQHNYDISRAFYPKATDITVLDEFYVLNTPEASESIYAEIVASGLTNWVEINEEVHLAPDMTAVTNSKRIDLGVNDPDADLQWAMESMNMPAYFALLQTQQPRQKTKIAILDTGVDAQHEDLKAVYYSTKSAYDNDPKGHGTHCAGIAAAVTNNGVGIASPAGMGGFVEITSIKVLSAGGMGTQKTIIQGMIEAIDSGVDVISMSLGGLSNSSRRRAYNQTVSYASRNNVIVVVSAGNSNREATDYAPANTAGVICVSALDPYLQRAPFSNKVGNIRMGLAAPGVGIYSTIPGSKYGAYSGTSMSCPFVAGLVGVMRAMDPELTTNEAFQILSRTGKRTSEVVQVGPVVQPVEALKAVLVPAS